MASLEEALSEQIGTGKGEDMLIKALANLILFMMKRKKKKTKTEGDELLDAYEERIMPEPKPTVSLIRGTT